MRKVGNGSSQLVTMGLVAELGCDREPVDVHAVLGLFPHESGLFDRSVEVDHRARPS